MRYQNNFFLVALFVFTLSVIILFPQQSFAHCDGLDGPVVIAAKKALETGNINLVLIWIQPKDEDTIKEAFDQTLKVRKLGDEARKLADRFFFETLVRIHRAGEGAPYTGLKPAGRDLGPGIPAADKALEVGSAKHLLKLLTDEIHAGLHKRLSAAIALKDFDKNDVKAGQKFVEAYVDFLHYAEGIYEASQKTIHGHESENVELSHHEEEH